MSKTMTDAELKQHIDQSLEKISSLMNEWAQQKSRTPKKRAQLLAYWVKDYARLLRNEDTFHPQTVPRLKRGCVISVDFGYRVGREFGGRHFAVVIDKKPALRSPIVTVVPLMSLKPDYKENLYTCLLEDGLYAPLFEQATAYYNSANRLIDESTTMIEKGTSLEEARAKAWAAKKMNEKAKSILDEIDHLKAGSVANTCQIITISKMRIKRPLKKDDPLYGVRLSTRDMEKINTQLKTLYLWE